jgi:hypothetical protein
VLVSTYYFWEREDKQMTVKREKMVDNFKDFVEKLINQGRKTAATINNGRLYEYVSWRTMKA